MKISVRTLLNVAIQHAYYTGACTDFEFLIPPATADVLRGGKLLARVVDGRLTVLFEVDADENVITSLAGETLTFGLRQVNPWFSNFTAPVITDGGLVPFYTNSANPAVFDAPAGIALVSGVFTYKPQTASRPLTVRLSNRANALIATEVLTEGEADVQFDLRAIPDGRYRIDEVVGASSLAERQLMLSAEFRNMALWGIVAIKIDEGFYAAPGSFVLQFAARTERLKYFVVAERFSETEFAELNVKDTGFNDDKRSELIFERVPATAFSEESNDIFPASVLGDASRVVMFRSKDLVARRERGLRKIQLKRKDDDAEGILVENLPLPGADRPQAHFIVHLSKPIGT